MKGLGLKSDCIILIDTPSNEIKVLNADMIQCDGCHQWNHCLRQDLTNSESTKCQRLNPMEYQTNAMNERFPNQKGKH